MAYIDILSENETFIARISVDDYNLHDQEDRRLLMERIAGNVREADHEDNSEWEDEDLDLFDDDLDG